jgi:hypothetical protein
LHDAFQTTGELCQETTIASLQTSDKAERKGIMKFFVTDVGFRFCPTVSSLPKNRQNRHVTKVTAFVSGSRVLISRPYWTVCFSWKGVLRFVGGILRRIKHSCLTAFIFINPMCADQWSKMKIDAVMTIASAQRTTDRLLI